ncbi:MAG: hypothetical protein LBS75_04810 [Synergistaceae bacterium]|nr:hypothetical protein [Synergistaceae bacterium]
MLLKNDGVHSAAVRTAEARAASVAKSAEAGLERVYETLSTRSGYVFAFMRSDSKTWYPEIVSGDEVGWAATNWSETKVSLAAPGPLPPPSRPICRASTR